MRGMMIGLFFFIWGLASANARIMMTAFGRSRSATPMTCDFWFNLFYMMVAVVGLACYLLVARRYRNRQRGEQDSDRFYRPPQPPLQR